MDLDEIHGQYKLFLLVGSEKNLVSVLKDTGTVIEQVPDFGARLSIVLVRRSGQYFVKMNYQGQPVNLSKLGCETPGECPVDTFLNFITGQIPEDKSMYQQCFDFLEPTLIDITSWLLIGVVAIVMIFVIVLCIASFRYLKRMNNNETLHENRQLNQNTIPSEV